MPVCCEPKLPPEKATAPGTSVTALPIIAPAGATWLSVTHVFVGGLYVLMPCRLPSGPFMNGQTIFVPQRAVRSSISDAESKYGFTDAGGAAFAVIVFASMSYSHRRGVYVSPSVVEPTTYTLRPIFVMRVSV